MQLHDLVHHWYSNSINPKLLRDCLVKIVFSEACILIAKVSNYGFGSQINMSFQ